MQAYADLVEWDWVLKDILGTRTAPLRTERDACGVRSCLGMGFGAVGQAVSTTGPTGYGSLQPCLNPGDERQRNPTDHPKSADGAHH